MITDFRRTSGAVLVLLLVLTATFALGQGIVTGTMSGAVQDPQGAAITNATIRATHVATNRVFTTVTNSTGQYQLRSLPPGGYVVRVEAPSFRKLEVKDVQVAVGQDTAMGLAKLEIGQTEQAITVEGTAPLVEASSIQIQNTFDTRSTADIPIGSTYDSLALFVPGVATAGSLGFSNNNGAEVSVNGQRTRSNNFQIDGQSNNDNSIAGPSFFFGNQDAVSELQVITNYTAEYGRNSGSVINYVTKSGTNAFHGTAYEFQQNSAFDSLTNAEKSPLFGFCQPFKHADGTPRGTKFPTAAEVAAGTADCSTPVVSKFIDNRFGGTMGGPIKRDKIWFFGSANFERQRFAGGNTSSDPFTTPTPNGISQLQAAFPGNNAVAALASFGPQAVKAGNPSFTNIGTQSVTVGGVTVPIETGVINRSIPSIFNDYEASGRVDFQLTQKDRLFARYLFQQTINTNVAFDGTTAAAGGDFVDVPARTQQIGLDYTRTFTPTFLDQIRYSYARSVIGFEGGAFSNCVQNDFSVCPPEVLIDNGDATGQFGVASGFPQGRNINNSQIQDNASWQKGKHTLKFGGEYDKQRSPNVFLPSFAGLFEFDDLNAFLSNTPNFTEVALGNPKLEYKEHDVAAYFQDDWRIKNNLTLNLGLRWEWFQQAINLLHQLSVKQQTGPNPFWDTSLPLSRTTVPSVDEDLNNFGPVVGFAWTPQRWKGLFGDSKTVIRGGFRIAYDPAFYNIFLNVSNDAPFVLLSDFFGTGSAPGLPPGTTFTANTIQAFLTPFVPVGGDPGLSPQASVPKNFHNPYSEQWSFGIQRELGAKVSAEVRYVGNHTVGEFQTINGNPALTPLIDAGFGNLIPAGLTPCADPNAPGNSDGGGHVDCTRSNVTERANTAFSFYHGLQTQLKMANWHGMTLTGSYTFSKTIDNASEIFSTGTGGQTNSFAQNPFNIGRGERGISGLDYPHVLGLLWIYDLPFRKDEHGLLGHALGGWQINGTYRYTSGQPFTIVQTRQSGTLCDPTDWTASSRDACRPILSNANAAFNAVGRCTDPTAANCGLVNIVTGLPANLSDVHWILNTANAATFFGSPFLGVGRNTARGEPISTANLAVFKNLKLNERTRLQFQAEAFNVLNNQWRGIPGVRADRAKTTFGTTKFNDNGGDTFAGNITTDGIGRRRMQFGLKLIF